MIWGEGTLLVYQACGPSGVDDVVVNVVDDVVVVDKDDVVLVVADDGAVVGLVDDDVVVAVVGWFEEKVLFWYMKHAELVE